MIMHYCDRCGKEIVFRDFENTFTITWPLIDHPRRSYVDLCDECNDSFEEWFNAKSNRVTKDKEESNEER